MSMLDIVRDEEEIWKQRDAVLLLVEKTQGRSKWPGMTYEQGVQATLDWLTGDAEEPPIEDADAILDGEQIEDADEDEDD